MSGADGPDLDAAAPDRVQLDTVGEIDVWAAAPVGQDQLAPGTACLDEAERARAARFRRALDRDRFVFAHVFLRRVLARYLGKSPDRVGIQRSVSGKPRLEPAGDLSFSLSHSADLAVVAVVRGRDVGVDVERLRHIDDALELARTHFSAREANVLRDAPALMRAAVFLEIWTRKESVVKAFGGGLAIPLDTFEVLPDHTGWLGPPVDRPDAPDFTVATIDVPAGYVGAVTVPGPPMPIRRMGSDPPG